MKEIFVKIGLNKYSLENIRYSAYSITDAAFVRLRLADKKTAEIKIMPKNGDVSGIKKRFAEELKNEKLREEIFKNNAELRKFLILKALREEKKSEPSADDGLSPEQEKELDDLIKQVEEEIKKEGEKKDPLKITQTWENKYGGKRKRK